MEQFKPMDATTNPSLILAVANQKKYAHLIEKAAQYGEKSGSWVFTPCNVATLLSYIFLPDTSSRMRIFFKHHIYNFIENALSLRVQWSGLFSWTG